MKKLDLNAYGVVEMSNAEMRKTDGGFLITAAIIIGGALLLSSCKARYSTTPPEW
jgi:hypothetical protein